MLIIILPLALMIVGVIIGDKFDEYYWDDYKSAGLVLGAMAGAILAFLISAWINIDYKDESIRKVQIVAIQDNIVTKGHFFLGSGYIDGELNYFFYKKSGKGFAGDKIPASEATIIEDGGNYIEYFKKVPSKKWQKVILLEPDDEFQEIHVPKGSIVQNYSFDLKN